MSRYLLYYAGYDLTTGLEQIGVAASDDLRAWARPVATPIIPVGSAGMADRAQTSNPCVLKVGLLFRMWYQGKTTDGRTSICYAESADGVAWKASADPVAIAPLSEAGTYRAGFQHPHVLFDRKLGRYRMWYVRQTVSGATIGHAQSKDGYTWDGWSDAVLVPSAAWEGTCLYYPFVRVLENGSYELWYTGRAPGKRWQSGRAISPDGIAWERDPANPVVPPHLLPFAIRTVADMLLASVRTHFGKSVNGVASPCLFSDGDRNLMLAHDVGIRGRLCTSLYKHVAGYWQLHARDILASGAGAWDGYFQADPFILAL